MPTSIAFPRQFTLDARIHGNPVQQLRRPELVTEAGDVSPWVHGGIKGKQAEVPGGSPVVVIKRGQLLPDGFGEVLRTSSGVVPADLIEAVALKATWARPLAASEPAAAEPEAVRTSWKGQFHFIEEEELPDGGRQEGLRPPQVGAVYAALAHWKVSSAVATIVMPTGTGKTETMLALLVHQRIPRLLVVVPNDALRTQIAEKFLTFGILKRFGVVGEGAAFPVVARLVRQLKTPEEAQDVFGPANVVITTMQILNGCAPAALGRVVELCSHLFIDEAHHVKAPTWENVRSAFVGKRILQFTATPFRNDRKHVDGVAIFNYPLHKAQEEGYFRPITFDHVWEFDPDKADQAIAAKALQHLRADLAAGRDHLLMARAGSIERADEVLKAYAGLPDLRAVIVHNKMTETEKQEALTAIRRREARIAVCVNMFGEGFDLPELKVAALHDVHKSLAVTLQYTGRFTRSKPDLGEATIVANLADTHVRDALRNLYAESADWNVLLRGLSEKATGDHASEATFFQEFDSLKRRLALQNVTPKMSTVAYRGRRDTWHPERIDRVVDPKTLYEAPAVSHRMRVAVFVTRTATDVDWGDFRDFQNVVWNLYVLYWDEDRRILYINSTEKNTVHQALAEAVIGDDAVRFQGEPIFRILQGIGQLSLTNLGLSHATGRSVKFTMFMGADVLKGVTEATQQGKVPSNLFGLGYSDMARVTAGCSAKGKMWSHLKADTIPDWVAWCDQVGEKLLDESIKLKDILKHVVAWSLPTERPTAVPIAIDWSADVHKRPEHTTMFEINGEKAPLFEVGLELLAFEETGPIRFRIFTEAEEAHVELSFGEKGVAYRVIKGQVFVTIAKRTVDLEAWLDAEPPTLHFHDRSLIIGGLLAKLPAAKERFAADRLIPWDWSGTNIQRESQGREHDSATVQYRLIKELLSGDYDVVFDDDDSYEAADVVTIKATDRALEIDLYHCKFSGDTSAGGRVSDLYEVCGQAQKSVARRENIEMLFDHLRRRDAERTKKYGGTRFQRGGPKNLKELSWQARRLPIEFRVHIVQPGVSKASVSEDQLQLLAATELYLNETFAIPLSVITSA